jgi:hypothetical protein
MSGFFARQRMFWEKIRDSLMKKKGAAKYIDHVHQSGYDAQLIIVWHLSAQGYLERSALLLYWADS